MDRAAAAAAAAAARHQLRSELLLLLLLLRPELLLRCCCCCISCIGALRRSASQPPAPSDLLVPRRRGPLRAGLTNWPHGGITPMSSDGGVTGQPRRRRHERRSRRRGTPARLGGLGGERRRPAVAPVILRGVRVEGRQVAARAVARRLGRRGRRRPRECGPAPGRRTCGRARPRPTLHSHGRRAARQRLSQNVYGCQAARHAITFAKAVTFANDPAMRDLRLSSRPRTCVDRPIAYHSMAKHTLPTK